MPPDDGPVTKADLKETEKRIKESIKSELWHQAADIGGLKAWRDQFVAEGGPWRRMDDRVRALEYLARSLRWVVGVLSPIAAWAAIEIITALVRALR